MLKFLLLIGMQFALSMSPLVDNEDCQKEPTVETEKNEVSEEAVSMTKSKSIDVVEDQNPETDTYSIR